MGVIKETLRMNPAMITIGQDQPSFPFQITGEAYLALIVRRSYLNISLYVSTLLNFLSFNTRLNLPI